MTHSDLERFRQLMRAAAEVCDVNGYPDHLIAPDLHALATATPEQLLGIVGKVEAETIERPDYYGKTGRLIVTPRDGA